MLRRIRIGFGLLALLLLAPLGFLIGRTLDSLDRERELQHAAVAQRVFDEAERALADFLRDEQARPADAYRGWPAGSAWTDGRPPFVQAYFHVDPTGALHTAAGAPEAANRLRAALAPSPRSPAALSPTASSAPPAPSPADLAPAESAGPVALRQGMTAKGDAPAPGTARNLQSIDPITGRARAGKGEAARIEQRDEEDAYSSTRALETLGRIAKTKAREQAAPSLDRRTASPRGAGPDPNAEADRTPRQDVFAAAAEPESVLEEMDFDVLASPAMPAPTPARRTRLALAPSRLTGERVDDAALLLYRTALDEAGRAVRQGMLVSTDELGLWLARRVLGESGLRDSLQLELSAATGASMRPLPTGRYVYDYRFAAPFEMLSLRLALSPLDDGGNARNVVWLSALLVAASTLGLYAVYRMSAVAVDFAERRSNFAAAVSHELKTPITAIRMYGEMLRDGMVSDDAKRGDYYRTITRESERLTRLIDNVLAWSRLERRQRDVAPVTADPSAAIREIVDVVAPHAAAEGFALELQGAEGLPPVRHDPDALQQILYNLIDNAIKYARGHAPARIEVEAAVVDGDVVVRVRDHGHGVPAKKLPRVFDAFYRGEGELTRETKGTGIGLALARALAESMQGRLVARNHPEGGFEIGLWLTAG